MGAPSHIPSKRYGLPLHMPPAFKLLLLLSDTVPPEPIPEGDRIYDLARKIRIIGLRIQGTESLKPHQQPVLVPENPAHGKGMGVFRAETVYDVRPHPIDDILQDLFQPFIIFFRMPHILPESIIIKGGGVLPLNPSLTAESVRPLGHILHRKCHGKVDAVSALVSQHCGRHAADPALLV